MPPLSKFLIGRRHRSPVLRLTSRNLSRVLRVGDGREPPATGVPSCRAVPFRPSRCRRWSAFRFHADSPSS